MRTSEKRTSQPSGEMLGREGGPTHAHGINRGRTRAAAAEAARKPDSALMLDPDAEGSGLREWFASLREVTDPESSSVTKDNHLEVDEQTRARNWGARLAAIKATRRDTARSFH